MRIKQKIAFKFGAANFRLERIIHLSEKTVRKCHWCQFVLEHFDRSGTNMKTFQPIESEKKWGSSCDLWVYATLIQLCDENNPRDVKYFWILFYLFAIKSKYQIACYSIAFIPHSIIYTTYNFN